MPALDPVRSSGFGVCRTPGQPANQNVISNTTISKIVNAGEATNQIGVTTLRCMLFDKRVLR